MLKNGELTYMSLFSSAGVGCYGFLQEGFHCVATNEIIDRRLAVQKANNKCELDSGYISGDISLESIKDKIYAEINKWAKRGNDGIDVVMATPPCQGISVINHKKNEKDIQRNSLVIESIEIIEKIKPRIFILENVQAFEKTYCVTEQNEVIRIGDYIRRCLGSEYTISSRILNFMNYGSNSSRTRTLVIGILNKYRNNISPYDLFPEYRKEKTLRDVIGDFPSLEWGEISHEDFYHSFRIYDEKMRPWIHDLKEGESAFDNKDIEKRPHRVIDGKIVENVKKNRDKYTRQKWDRFIQCVHTRNDQLAAQNTVHPEQDRVFSIRELMEMMTVPHEFKWLDKSLDELNRLSIDEKKKVYKQHEVNIRQCLGEAVPTEIIRQIAYKIKNELSKKRYESVAIGNVIKEYKLTDKEKLKTFIISDPLQLGISGLQKIVEMCNAKRNENAAFYTNKFMISEMMDALPEFSKETLRIIEPSVGAGSFLPLLISKYAYVPSVIIDVVDIDQNSIDILEILISKMNVPDNICINVICSDFLKFDAEERYDLAIGNPPYAKLKDKSKEMLSRLEENVNRETNDLAAFFLEKCMRIADYTALVLNKTILSNGEYRLTRELLTKVCIDKIIDFGRYGFSELSIETIALMVDVKKKPGETFIKNLRYNISLSQKQSYITDSQYPYYIIYRNGEFDTVASKLEFNVFDVFRDRQITKKNTISENKGNCIRVIKARNISDDGTLSDIPGYDRFIDYDSNQHLTVMQYVNNMKIYLTPNMTYKTRVIRNVKNVVPDGSVAVLFSKDERDISDEQLSYFATDEYRKFYFVARNMSTQSINVDKTSVFFYGVKKDDE
ncbi:DNA cytosine methyltransferase [Coprococcus sp. AF27-8]|nr:DNA cytosine methyltransferase [Coprococcus sp. AF27-8]